MAAHPVNPGGMMRLSETWRASGTHLAQATPSSSRPFFPLPSARGTGIQMIKCSSSSLPLRMIRGAVARLGFQILDSKRIVTGRTSWKISSNSNDSSLNSSIGSTRADAFDSSRRSFSLVNSGSSAAASALKENFQVFPSNRREISCSAQAQDQPQDPETGGVTGRERESGNATFVVTTPLYYANAAPHMGSAYPTMAADALARFQRLRGRRVVFVTGTDEHGEKIALSAAASGRSPQQHCDLVAEEYRALWKMLNISADRFIRTTQQKHEKVVLQFFQRVWQKGDIFRAEYEGLYCVACEEYKDAKELLEDGSCPIHRKPCQERKEDNFFFSLSKYQRDLEQLLEHNPDFVRPSFRRNEVLGWVEEGVRDFSISRAAVDWGIPVPTEPKQTIYVWFDALVGYISALLEEGEEATLENALAKGWPPAVHIIGKDILRFHAIYWPAMLLSAGLPLPVAVYGHGFLTKDGLKMGKSLGNTLDPVELVSKYGSDAVRYYFLKEIEFGRDGDFSEERFVNIVNANLANTIGNLLNRTLGLLKKNCDSCIPADANTVPESHPLRALAAASVPLAAEHYEALQFSAVCQVAVDMAAAGNVYLEERAPWTKFKKGGEGAESAAMDLLVVLELSRVVAIVLHPVVPNVSLRILQQLSFSEEQLQCLSWEDAVWGRLRKGMVLPPAAPVFIRIPDDESADSPPKLSKAAAAKRKGKGMSAQVKVAALE